MKISAAGCLWIVFGLCAGGLCFRGLYESRLALQRADAAWARGDLEWSIVDYEHAAQWYVPFSVYSSRAFSKLWSVGERARKQGRVDSALLAFRAYRGACVSVRSVPKACGRLHAVDARVAMLMASFPAAVVDAQYSIAERKQRYLEELNAAGHPLAVGWSLLAIVGGILLLLSLFRYPFQVCSDLDGSLAGHWSGFFNAMWALRRPAWYGSLGLGLFVLGLYLA